VSYAEVALWINGETALRGGFVQRFAPLARDRAFRAPLLAELRAHPEWRRVLFPEQTKARARALAANSARPAESAAPNPGAVPSAAQQTSSAPMAAPAPAAGLPLTPALVETLLVRAN
jgi:hypothetical protein